MFLSALWLTNSLQGEYKRKKSKSTSSFQKQNALTFHALVKTLNFHTFSCHYRHWPDFQDKDDLSKLGAEAFAFVNFARFAVPLRIGLALGTTPWVQENIVDKFLSDKEKEKDTTAPVPAKTVAVKTMPVKPMADKPLPDTPKVAPPKAASPKTAPANAAPEPGSKEALREQLKRQRDSLSKQVEAKETPEETIVEEFAPPSQEIDTTFSDSSYVEDTSNVEPAFVPNLLRSAIW